MSALATAAMSRSAMSASARRTAASRALPSRSDGSLRSSVPSPSSTYSTETPASCADEINAGARQLRSPCSGQQRTGQRACAPRGTSRRFLKVFFQPLSVVYGTTDNCPVDKLVCGQYCCRVNKGLRALEKHVELYASQAALANALRCDPGHLSRILNDKKSAGLAFRQACWETLGIEMHLWDEQEGVRRGA